MAKKIASDCRVYFGGYDPGTATTRILVNLETKVLDPTAIVDSAERSTAGERADSIEWAGLFDDGTSMDAAQASLIATGTSILSISIGTTAGDIGYSGTLLSLSGKASSRIGELVGYEAAFKPDQAFDRVKLLTVKRSDSAASTFGTVDDSGSSLAGGIAYLHLFNFTGAGTGTALLNVDSAPDGSGWVNRLTQIINVGTTQKSIKRSFTGTLDRYVRGYFAINSGTAEYAMLYKRS